MASRGLTGEAFEKELHRILRYWSTIVFDETRGCFYPKVDHANRAYPQALSSAVMYARILWAFSASYRHSPDANYLKMADAAYRYIQRHFIDPQHGGVYWSLRADGTPADDRKHSYAIAFTIYGLVEYYQATKDAAILTLAKQLYRCIEQYSLDPLFGGYIEACGRDWTPTDQLRLSAKDDNERKTLNTHLHILEAYTALYEAWPDDGLKSRIADLLGLFSHRFVNQNNHLQLFFDDRWHPRSSLQSFGHDIEASWLICEAAYAIHSGHLPPHIHHLALRLANACMEWVDESGALCYELDPVNNDLNSAKHWWVQAEAVVGFYRAGILTGDSDYTFLATRIWQYITDYLIDNETGEWYWGRNENGRIMDNEDKAGFWKCPYHNSRCCLQMIRLLG